MCRNRLINIVSQVWDIIGRGIVVAEGKDDLGLGDSVLSKVKSS